MNERYRFDTIFSYYPTTATIIPQFTVIINNIRFNADQPITKNDLYGNLNLFNYVGRDIAGIWNRETRELTILGFY